MLFFVLMSAISLAESAINQYGSELSDEYAQEILNIRNEADKYQQNDDKIRSLINRLDSMLASMPHTQATADARRQLRKKMEKAETARDVNTGNQIEFENAIQQGEINLKKITNPFKRDFYQNLSGQIDIDKHKQQQTNNVKEVSKNHEKQIQQLFETKI